MANVPHNELDSSLNAVHKRLKCKSLSTEDPAAPKKFRSHRRKQSEIQLLNTIGWNAVSDKSCTSNRIFDLENLRDAGCFYFTASQTDTFTVYSRPI